MEDEWYVESIRDEWHSNSVRLPESLQHQFDQEYKRVSYELGQAQIEREFRKDRQFKPLVVALGLRELRQQDPYGVAQLLAELEQGRLVTDE